MVTGKPMSLGGSPGREAATGRGVVDVYREAARGRIITELGCKLIGVSNTSGAIHCDGGIDPNALLDHLARGGKLVDFPQAEPIPAEELVSLDCEVLIPAAIGGTIHAANVESIRARVVIEAANNPTTPAADEILQDKGVLVVPDVLANAGGVVVSYFEWVQNLQHLSWQEHAVNVKLAAKMREAYRAVEQRADRGERTSLRLAAYELAIERVLEATRLRGCGGYA